jgi:uncharacterized repeat protein (TIGR02543 family)
MRRILSIFLTLFMVVTLLPVTAIAEEIHMPIGTSGEIINFAPLAETEKAVSLGTASEDLELSETLIATVRTAVNAGEEPVQDSGGTVEDTPPIAAAYGLVSPMDITTYNIWVGSVRVTSENKDNITGDGITGTVTYNPVNKTLTLNNATITKGYSFSRSYIYYAGIVAFNDDLTIELLGQCSITPSAPDNPDYYPCGMYLDNGNFTLSGSGTLNVRGANQKTSYGIYNSYGSSGSLTISGPTVTATGGTTSGGSSYGIYAEGDLTILGGTVISTGSQAYCFSYGICTEEVLSISGAAVVSAVGGEAGSGYSSHGIYAPNESSTISSGTVIATGDNSGWDSYGINTGTQTLYIAGGTVTAQAGSAPKGAAAINGVLDTSGYTDVKTLTGASASPAKVVDSYTNERYAKFGIMETYSVTYVGNGGGGSMMEETAAAGVAFPLPECAFTPTEGKTFDKWAVGSIDGAQVAANASVTFTEDKTLYALWKITPTADDLAYNLAAVEYDGTAKPVSVTAAPDKTLGAITVIYNGITTAAPINAGVYAVTVDIAGNAVYNSVTGLSLGSYTINKIAYTGKNTVLASVFTSGQTGAIVTLPDLPIGASYGTPVAGGTIAMTSMSIAETTLTYTAPASTTGQSGMITIPVTGATNYNNYNIVVTVTSTAKTPQVISYATATIAKTYGAGRFTNLLTQTTVNGMVTYASDNTSVATVNPDTGEVTIVAAGSATITATAAETSTHAQAATNYTMTVARKELTLKAEDKSMTKGDGLPAFTYTVTELVNDDSVTTAPTMSTTADGTAVGSFDITITDGVVTNAASYDIIRTKGILTVAERLLTVTVTNGTGSGSYAESGTVTITANDRSGYTFTGWSGADVTFANAAAKTTTFTMPAKAVTVTANYRQNSSGGDGGGNTSSPTPTPDPGKTDQSEGQVEKEQQQNIGAPAVSINNSSDELKSRVLTATEQEMVAKGENAKVILKVTDISASVSEEEKALIQEQLSSKKGEEVQSVLYVDLSLYKQVGSRGETRITETNGKIRITLEVPESFWSTDVTKSRAFYVVRIHDKEVTRIDGSYDPATHLFTFETDRFSTYALTYQDFYHLQLTAKAKKTSQTLSYKKVANVDGYLIYGAVCGKEMKKLAEVSADTVSYKVKNLKSGTYYKYQVKAYRIIDGEAVVIMTSRVVHSVTEGKTYANPTKVTLNVTSVKLMVGESKTVFGQVVLPKGKKGKAHTAAIRYESTDKKVATINSKGKIAAKAKGVCYVYAYAQNGVYKRIEVTVE